jgi:subtilisin family serine protease
LVGYSSDAGIYAPAKNGKLVVVRALDKSGKSTSIDLARAIYYAIDNDVDVINCSWGGGGVTEALKDAFQDAYMHGITIFSSAGNDGSGNDPPSTPEVPKNFAGVIGVGAINQRGKLPSYSNYGGKSVKFLAPGDQMLSAIKDGGYGVLSGTSMASPIAASAYSWIFGLLKAKCRQSACSKPKRELQALAVDLLCKGAGHKGVEGRSICGIISVEASTKLVVATPI